MNTKKLEGWLLTAKPDEIIAEIRRRIRAALGDEVENKTRIFASHGYYRIVFMIAPNSDQDQVLNDMRDWDNIAFRRGAVKQLAKDLAAAKRRANKPAF